MERRLLHTRFLALVAGVGIACALVLGVLLILPQQSVADAGTDYGYEYSGIKSQSVAFANANMDDKSLLLFGSSELSTPKRLVPQVPEVVFGEHNYGLRLMMVGEAYDQSLWHAIALGAYAQAGVPRDKVVLIVGPGWFVDGGMDKDTFATRFSYALYAGFCENIHIPDQVKGYVRQRLLENGIDETELSSCAGSLPQDALNKYVFNVINDVKLRRGLDEVRAGGVPLQSGDEEVPDFAALREQALVDGAAISTTNDWGVEDGFYTERLEPVLADAKDSRTDESYTNTPEYDDLACFLDVADACGIEVLVVLSPVMGPYYDHIGVSVSTREHCYSTIREVVAAHESAQLADFSDCEYEPYFLYDIVHFGTLGWTEVDHAIYEFAQGETIK